MVRSEQSEHVRASVDEHSSLPGRQHSIDANLFAVNRKNKGKDERTESHLDS